MPELFPILSDDDLLAINGYQELLKVKQAYPEPINPEEKRHPMCAYYAPLAIRRATALAERRHVLEMLLTQLAGDERFKNDPVDLINMALAED